MKNLFLNIGCGDQPVKGFVNIDIAPNADMQLDVTNGLPFENNSVNGIYSEHFIEHLTQSEGIAFFRECRRILKDDGVLRIATPDLMSVVQNYIDRDWAEKTELDKYGFEWIDNACEFLNISMREWGHQWLYDENELIRLLKYAGFYTFKRCEFGKSDKVQQFNDIETRSGSRLIVEALKQKKSISNGALVSIIIPAYSPRYFEIALQSALNQTYKNIEIIVCDDSCGTEIESIVNKYQTKMDKKLVYIKNGKNLGERKNTFQCFSKANGEYISQLNDDDVLKPDCVEIMVDYLQKYPEVTLVTSHREIINELGEVQPDLLSTKRITETTGIINGIRIVRTMASSKINFIGEPTTTTYRKNDLILDYPDDIYSFAGRKVTMNGDVALWMKLLSRGDLLYISNSLSQFRLHKEQAQRRPKALKNGETAWSDVIHDAKRMGFFEKYFQLDKQSKAKRTKQPGRQVISNGKNRLLVSIIIPVFNKIEFTKKCLKALEKNTIYSNYEIIIIDNASTDGTAKYLDEIKKTNKRIRIITNEKNMGFAKANNRAAEIANGDYLLLLNNDTEVEENWLISLVEIAQNDPSVGAVGSKLLFPDRTIQHAGVIICDDTLVGGDPLIAKHIYGHEKEDFSEANELRVYKALTAACMFIPKKIFKELNGFDEGYWNGYEDVDLCLKMHKAGYKLVYQPKSVIIHHESKSGPERFSKVTENVKRLNDRWINENMIDVRNKGNGEYEIVETHGVKEYHIPTKKSNDIKSLVSIIMLTYNALEYTKKCVDSIIKNTKYPYEIIFVDNASTDGSVEYLRELVKEHSNFKIIENKENKGFASGNNQGVKAANGKYVMLLNNDVLVSQGWLGRLIESIEKDDKIGAVGPITNLINGRQMVPAEKISYKKDEDFFPFSQFLLNHNKGRITPRRRLAGFAMLMEKSLYNEVGGLDEDFGIGNFEDDDLSLKIREKGFSLMVDDSVYIHHYGSQSFIANKIDYIGNMKERFSLFHKKWPRINYEELIELKKPLDVEEKQQLEIAVRYLENGKIDDAKNVLSKIILWNPISQDALFAQALCARKEGDNDTALNYLRKILSLNPNNADALNQAGLIAIENGDLLRAQTLFISSIENDPNFIDAQRNLSECLLMREEFDEGVRMYLSILEKHPQDVPTLLRMAQLHLEAGNNTEAKEWAAKVLIIAENNSLAKEIARV